MLGEGIVFKFRNPKFPQKCRPHIVVAVTPTRKVLYVAATTKIQRTIQRCRSNPMTGVLAPIADCPALDNDSAINCNESYVEEEYVLRKQDSFEECGGGIACPDLLNKIKGGILKSNNTANTPGQKIIKELAATPAQPTPPPPVPTA